MFASAVSRISGAINNVFSGIQRAVSSLVSGIGMAVSGVMSGIGGLWGGGQVLGTMNPWDLPNPPRTLGAAIAMSISIALFAAANIVIPQFLFGPFRPSTFENAVRDAVQNMRESLLPNLRNILPLEVFMFAAVIYGEVGDERFPRDEWIAVGWSIRNRVEDRSNWGGWAGWPNTYYGVLTQPDSGDGRQYHAYLEGKYRAAMNFYLGYNRYSNTNTLSADDRRVILDCLAIAIGIYYNVVYTTDLSRGANLFWQSAIGPTDWRRPFIRANTPLAMTEGGRWRHTFWRVFP